MRREKRSKPLRMDELLAYLGLQLAMSVHKLDRVQDYWCSSDLLSNALFKKTMSRDSFLNIKAALRIYPAYDPYVAAEDPLWHSRQIPEHFLRNCATMAVPVGVSSLDENTIRCKGRSAARSYVKSKPIKFGIRFYAVVGWAHAYLHLFQDNGSGNKGAQSPFQRYTKVFRGLRGAVERKVDDSMVSKSSPTALWCTQMAHQTYLYPFQGRGRLMVMDNFYTRHVMARQLFSLSDRECRVLGTVRFTNVDGINREALKEAIEVLKHAPRGDWRLVQVFQKVSRTDSTLAVAENAGFVVFKDRSVVTFYTNDLADTPILRINQPDAHAIRCVLGLGPLQRWIGEESLRRTTLEVPAVIVAYNLFMNGVDRFDQFCSTTAAVRKKKRVTMSIFSFVLDASILNAHALLHAISKQGESIMDVALMKRGMIMQLLAEHAEYQQQRASLSTVASAVPSQKNRNVQKHSNARPHLLLETEGKKSVHCCMCSLLTSNGWSRYTIYSCSECRQGYHVNCFTFYHNRELFRQARPDIYEANVSAERSQMAKYRRKRTNKSTSSIATAVFCVRNKAIPPCTPCKPHHGLAVCFGLPQGHTVVIELFFLCQGTHISHKRRICRPAFGLGGYWVNSKMLGILLRFSQQRSRQSESNNRAFPRTSRKQDPHYDTLHEED